jgi:hypothetical protein
MADGTAGHACTAIGPTCTARVRLQTSICALVHSLLLAAAAVPPAYCATQSVQQCQTLCSSAAAAAAIAVRVAAAALQGQPRATLQSAVCNTPAGFTAVCADAASRSVKQFNLYQAPDKMDTTNLHPASCCCCCCVYTVRADAATRSVKQSNLYQAPDKMAGPSTRFLPYLTGNAMSGRPDGYGLRVWEFKPDSDLINVSAVATDALCCSSMPAAVWVFNQRHA